MLESVVEGVRLRGRELLLERDAELAVIAGAVAGAVEGRGSVVLVEGPPGIGKTSLLRATCELARDRDLRIVMARGFALEGDFPFGVVRQLFEPVRLATAEREWAQLLDGAAGLAARVFDGGEISRVQDDAPYATLHGLFWLAANLAAERPLVVVVDDVQWADPPSLRWLAHLAHRLQGLPILLVLARRTGPDSRSAALLDELRAAARPVLRPGTLSLEATAALVRGWLGEHAHGELSAACRAATGGNPFLLDSLLSALAAEGIVHDGDAIAHVAKLGPEPVARTVMRRVSALPDGAEALTRALAVFGGPVALRLAAALGGQPPEAAGRVADALRAAGVLAPGSTLEFAHPIVRTAIYEAIAPGERALWHAQAAALLAREDADAERVALHLLHSEPAGSSEVVELLWSAARSASGRGAPDAAAVHLIRALDEPPDHEAKPALLTELGLALAADRRAAAPQILREAVELSTDPRERAERALLSARLLGLWAYYDIAAEICRDALAARDSLDPTLVDELEAELCVNAGVSPATIAEALTLVAGHADDPAASSSWRIIAAFVDSMRGRPAVDSLARLGPLLAGELSPPAPDSTMPGILMLALAYND
ncbi:MAG: AAA family ATPase, partial [Solirubrobacterales bacterium]|nr:AAA family ATPase [Solirubrobacterales bacterium]